MQDARSASLGDKINGLKPTRTQSGGGSTRDPIEILQEKEEKKFYISN